MPFPARAEEAPLSLECSSISHILADPRACDNHPVRLVGEVVQFGFQTSRAGRIYTEFTLADNSGRLDVFSYHHLPLERGICLRVEGTYYRQRKVGSRFKSEVVVDRRGEGIAKVPCPQEGRKQGEVPRGYTPSMWRWGKIVGLAMAILLVSGLVVRLAPARYYRMGRAFEEFVIGLFPEPEWEIEDRSSDTSKNIGRRVTGDVSYDCIVKHRPTSRGFILQCKYRSRFFRQAEQEGIEWAKTYQIRNYRDFQRTKGWPYLVIIGVGGRPRRPHQLFVLSLERLHDPFIQRNEILAARRDPRAFFTIDEMIRARLSRSLTPSG